MNQNIFAGPFIDDVAKYSAIGEIELHVFKKEFEIVFSNSWEHICASLNESAHLQYENGSHESTPRKIIECVDIMCVTDAGNEVLIKQIVLKGSSKWVIGKTWQLMLISSNGTELYNIPLLKCVWSDGIIAY